MRQNSALQGEGLQGDFDTFGKETVALQGMQCALAGAAWELASARQGIADYYCLFGRDDILLWVSGPWK